MANGYNGGGDMGDQLDSAMIGAVGGALSWIEWGKQQALADAAAEAAANNLPLIATVPPGTPNPNVWISPDAPAPVGTVPQYAPESMADKLRRLSFPLALGLVAVVIIGGISMTDKPWEPFR